MYFMITGLLGAVLSFLLIFVIMPFYIDRLKKANINQEVSEYSLEEYKQKAKTPIMGGLLFVLFPVVVNFLINGSSLHNRAVLMVAVSYLLYCLVGFLDDLCIIITRNNEGISPKAKLIMEFIFAGAVFFFFRDVLSFSITIPILDISISLSWYLYLPLIILMYMAEANAVNFTDGMDGLCAGTSFIGLCAFLFFLYLKKENDLFIFVLCVQGGLTAYLCYNHFPAKIFMGDSGSLALGALFSAIALVSDTEIVLLVIGAVFLIEMLCVCLQLSSVRLFKRRIFSYTPIHYAFVLKGYKETAVVRGFYIAAILFALLGILLGIL